MTDFLLVFLKKGSRWTWRRRKKEAMNCNDCWAAESQSTRSSNKTIAITRPSGRREDIHSRRTTRDKKSNNTTRLKKNDLDQRLNQIPIRKIHTPPLIPLTRRKKLLLGFRWLGERIWLSIGIVRVGERICLRIGIVRTWIKVVALTPSRQLLELHSRIQEAVGHPGASSVDTWILTSQANKVSFKKIKKN